MILLIDNGSKHTPELKRYFRTRKIKYVLAKPNSRLRHLMKHRFKGVILSGGPLLYDEKINIKDVDIDFAVLLDLNVPVLGICFGHQSIAEAFDGRLKKKKRIGHMAPVHIVRKSRLMAGVGSKPVMQEYHTDCVTEIPYNFDLLAKSTTCEVEAMKHKTRHIYGFQFHPEASGEAGWRLLDNFMKICKIAIRR